MQKNSPFSKQYRIFLILLVATFAIFSWAAMGCSSGPDAHNEATKEAQSERQIDAGADTQQPEAKPERGDDQDTNFDGGVAKPRQIELQASQVALGECLRYVSIAGQPHCAQEHQIVGAMDGRVYASFTDGSRIIGVASEARNASFLVQGPTQVTLYASRDGAPPVALRSFGEEALASPSGVHFVGQEQLFVGGGSGQHGRLLVSVGLNWLLDIPLQVALFPRWQTISCSESGQGYPCYGLDEKERVLSSQTGQLSEWSDVSTTVGDHGLQAPLMLRIARVYEGEEAQRPLLLLDADGGIVSRCGGRWRRENLQINGQHIAFKNAQWIADDKGRHWLFLLGYDGVLAVRSDEGLWKIHVKSVSSNPKQISIWPGGRLVTHHHAGTWALSLAPLNRLNPWSCR